MKGSNKRIISSSHKDEDTSNYAYRPLRLSDFIGQDNLISNFEVYIKAAKARGGVLDHILLHGPPGLGKTTLAHIIARELGVGIKVVQAPILEKTGDIASHLSNLSLYDVLFIDEIHRLRPAVEELLYSAMEDFKLDIVVGKGVGSRIVSIPVPEFTLVGATTRAGLLTSPFLSRFGIVSRLDFYSLDALAKVVKRTANLMKISIDKESLHELAKRSRGTPRVVNRIMRRVRDFAEVEGDGSITIGIVNRTLESLGIDSEGLDLMDRRLLMLIMDKHDGGPVGIDTLAVSLGETSDTLEDVYEPYLIQKGFLSRTARGRVATSYCYRYFDRKQDSLF